MFFNSLALSSDCSSDFVQFGRDVLFITSHRSRKFCGNMKEITGDRQESDKVQWTQQEIKRRSYSEEKDSEMDIWIKVGGKLNYI